MATLDQPRALTMPASWPIKITTKPRRSPARFPNTTARVCRGQADGGDRQMTEVVGHHADGVGRLVSVGHADIPSGLTVHPTERPRVDPASRTAVR
jgi:hypothetical protein